jgi:hypothetical protein
MAHFAQLDANNVVTEVIVVSNDAINDLPFPESEPVGVEFCQSLYGANTIWKQTSYNANFRKNYAGLGYSYRADINAFVPPQPYPSWTLNDETAEWEAPIPYPTDGKAYVWDENSMSWVPLPIYPAGLGQDMENNEVP